MKPKIIIGEEYDGFTIVVGKEHFRFDQEEPVGEKMIRLLERLGYTDIVVEEWY